MIPVEEYLQTSYRPDVDYIDGELIDRNVGEWNHGRLLGLTGAWLFEREARMASAGGSLDAPADQSTPFPHPRRGGAFERSAA